MERKIEIIITDDHEIFTQSLMALLNGLAGMTVIGCAGNGADLLKQLEIKVPHIVLLDLNMPVMNGEKTINILTVRYPELKILVLSVDFQKDLIEKYYKLGVHGFMPKECNIEVLLEAIELIMTNGKSQELSFSYLAELKKQSLNLDDFVLSDREKEVLKLIGLGKRNKHIAYFLTIGGVF